MAYLEKSCDSLEQYITRVTGASQSSAHAVKLKQGAYMFTVCVCVCVYYLTVCTLHVCNVCLV